MIRTALLAVAMLLLLAPEAQAQRGHITSCVVSATGVAFGRFFGSRVDSTGTIMLLCQGNGNNANPYTVALSQGFSHSFLPRTMAHAGQGAISTLSYNLYLDAARTTIWGNGQGGKLQLFTGSLSFPMGNPATANLPVYARIPTQSPPPAGLYADQIIVTVSF